MVGEAIASYRQGAQSMAALPAELAVIPEETAVVGDIEAFIDYIENGQALRDWHDRLAMQMEECDAFLREHSHVWSHIIIQSHTLDMPIPQAA
jgi:hypothetical protein